MGAQAAGRPEAAASPTSLLPSGGSAGLAVQASGLVARAPARPLRATRAALSVCSAPRLGNESAQGSEHARIQPRQLVAASVGSRGPGRTRMWPPQLFIFCILKGTERGPPSLIRQRPGQWLPEPAPVPRVCIGRELGSGLPREPLHGKRASGSPPCSWLSVSWGMSRVHPGELVSLGPPGELEAQVVLLEVSAGRARPVRAGGVAGRQPQAQPGPRCPAQPRRPSYRDRGSSRRRDGKPRCCRGPWPGRSSSRSAAPRGSG